MKRIKLIVTLGPSSLKSNIIKKLKKDVSLFRLNMSHLNLTNLENSIKKLKKLNIGNICIDTEGAQVRTVKVRKKLLAKKQKVYLSNEKLKLKNLIQLYPNFDFSKIKNNSKIKIGFEGLELKVKKNHKLFLECIVTEQGYLESNKGVHFEDFIQLDPLTKKDLSALEIGKKYNINHYALSFANKSEDVKYLKSKLSKKAKIISKIETKMGFLNKKKICRYSDAILVDRGDLSRYIDISKIPLAQRLIVKEAKKFNKEVYIATNLLETMINSSDPTRAESNDIYSSLESGCVGLVLAAETAIGKYPIACIKFLKECVKVHQEKKKLLLNQNYFFKNN